MTDEKKVCQHCGEPGGRLVMDPYQKAVYDERVIMRLHAECADRRRKDI